MLNLYCVYDKIAEQFAPPMVARNHAMASRLFAKMFGDSPHLQPDDYELYYVGNFFDTLPKSVDEFIVTGFAPQKLTPLVKQMADLTEVK